VVSDKVGSKQFGDENLELAEWLFKHYDGNKYHMFREEYISEYKKLNVPLALEMKWLDEVQDELIKKLLNNADLVAFRRLINTITVHKTYGRLNELCIHLSLAKDCLDEYKKYEIAHTFTHMLKDFKQSGTLYDLPSIAIKNLALSFLLNAKALEIIPGLIIDYPFLSKTTTDEMQDQIDSLIEDIKKI
jgi:hypothetical protein